MRSSACFLVFALISTGCSSREVLDLGGDQAPTENTPAGAVMDAGAALDAVSDASTGSLAPVIPFEAGFAPTGATAPSCDSGTCAFVTGQWILRNLAIDGPYLYWLNTDGWPETTAVMRVPLAGGPIEKSPLNNKIDNTQFTANGDSLYWLWQVSTPIANLITKTALDGTNGTVLPMAQSTGEGLGFANNGTDLFWITAYGPASIMKMPLAGGTPTPIVSNVAEPFGVAADGANAYWLLNSGDGGAIQGNLFKTPLDGSGSTLLATGLGNVDSTVATDGANVYWVSPVLPADDAGPNSVMKVPVGGGTPVAIASLSPWVTEVVVDDTSAYVLSPPGHSITKIAPK